MCIQNCQGHFEELHSFFHGIGGHTSRSSHPGSRGMDKRDSGEVGSATSKELHLEDGDGILRSFADLITPPPLPF